MNLRTGAFRKTTFWILASPFLLLLVSGMLAESAEAKQRNNVAFASVATLKSQLPNASGFKVEAMQVTDAGAACIQFRTRDGIGGTSRDQAVVVGRDVAQSSARDGRFEKAWNRQCLGQSYDVTGSVDHFF
jgi:hypothetical protein